MCVFVNVCYVKQTQCSVSIRVTFKMNCFRMNAISFIFQRCLFYAYVASFAFAWKTWIIAPSKRYKDVVHFATHNSTTKSSQISFCLVFIVVIESSYLNKQAESVCHKESTHSSYLDKTIYSQTIQNNQNKQMHSEEFVQENDNQPPPRPSFNAFQYTPHEMFRYSISDAFAKLVGHFWLNDTVIIKIAVFGVKSNPMSFKSCHYIWRKQRFSVVYGHNLRSTFLRKWRCPER